MLWIDQELQPSFPLSIDLSIDFIIDVCCAPLVSALWMFSDWNNKRQIFNYIHIPDKQGCARFAEILTVFKWTHKNLGVQASQNVKFE